MIRILLADDHVLFRAGLRRILEEQPEFMVVAEASSGLEAVELAKNFGGTDGHKYVNGVLDKAAAELRPVEVQAARAARR